MWWTVSKWYKKSTPSTKLLVFFAYHILSKVCLLNDHQIWTYRILCFLELTDFWAPVVTLCAQWYIRLAPSHYMAVFFCEMDAYGHTSVKFELTYKMCSTKKMHMKILSRNIGHFGTVVAFQTHIRGFENLGVLIFSTVCTIVSFN